PSTLVSNRLSQHDALPICIDVRGEQKGRDDPAGCRKQRARNDLAEGESSARRVFVYQHKYDVHRKQGNENLRRLPDRFKPVWQADRKSTRLNSINVKISYY